MKNKLIELLYQSFDGTMTEDEQRELDQALIDSPELRDEQQKLEKLRASLADTKAKSFGPYFVKRVMAEINSIPGQAVNGSLFFEMMFRWFKPVAAVGVTLVIAFSIVNLLSADNVSVMSALGVTENLTEEIWATPLEQFVTGN